MPSVLNIFAFKKTPFFTYAVKLNSFTDDEFSYQSCGKDHRNKILVEPLVSRLIKQRRFLLPIYYLLPIPCRTVNFHPYSLPLNHDR